jgi:hypothetical protein
MTCFLGWCVSDSELDAFFWGVIVTFLFMSLQKGGGENDRQKDD